MFRKLRIRLLLISSIVLVASLSLIAVLTWRTTSQLSTIDFEVETITEQTGGIADTRTVETVTVIANLNRTIWFGIILVGLAALLLTTALIYRALGPVEQLTQAVRRMAEGHLDQRLPVQSSDEIGELTHAFNRMAIHLQTQESLRRHLMNDIAHELRSPLTHIQCQLEAVQDGLAKPDNALIESLHMETLLLKDMVGDLQDLALAEAGRLTLYRQSVRLETLIEEILQAVAPAAQNKQISIECFTPAELPAVTVDLGRIRQVIRNLLDNAIHFTPVQGTITITLQCDDQNVILVIADSGPGIATEHLPHIFDRFYRSDPARSRVTGGTGLGLAIAKQFAEAHGGHIRAESTVGQGTTFTLTLPRQAANVSRWSTVNA